LKHCRNHPGKVEVLRPSAFEGTRPH
jgi:hypothetical protein